MLLRAHRVADAMHCWKLCFNRYHRGYEREDDWNLRDGSALHAAIQVGRRTSDWQQAINHVETHIQSNFEPTFDHEYWEMNQHIAIVERCVDLYSAEWAKVNAEVRVVAPECEFEVALPNSAHHCVFKGWQDKIHNAIHREPPTAEQIINHVVRTTDGVADWHWVAGRTDSVIEWNGQIWVDEFKTSSITGDRFWQEFMLDIQPTIYCYGVWKTTGVMPAGVIIHQFYKPSEKQVASYAARRKDPSTAKALIDYVTYDRQFFTRDEDDLRRLEHDLVYWANEWERHVVDGEWPMANTRGQCTQWNRLCDFHSACLQHDKIGFEGLSKQSDPERLRLYHIDGAQE